MFNRIIQENTARVSIGIDVHKNKFSVVAISEGKKLKNATTPPTTQAVLKFISRFKGRELVVCYEAGFSGFWLYRELQSHGVKVLVINPASIESNLNDRVKTDKKDAYRLAHHLDGNRLESIHIPSTEMERMRQVSRCRAQLVKIRTSIKIQIKARFTLFGVIPHTDNREMSLKMAKEYLLISQENSELCLCVKAQLEVWQMLNKQIKELEKDLERQSVTDKHIDQVWGSMPSFGLITRRTMANELGDMSQFSNEKQLFSYCGLTPTERSSGEKIRRGGITHQGKSQLRAMLVEAAWRAIKEDPVLKEFYNRLLQRSNGKKAIVAVARKLLARARAAFNTGGYIINYNG